MKSKSLTISAVLLLLLLAVGPSLISCNGCRGESNVEKNQPDTMQVITLEEIPTINQVEGTVGDETTMHVLQLITDAGDTLFMEHSDLPIVGGAKVGDRVYVIYNMIGDEAIISVATNISSLQHLWSQRAADGHKQSLELSAGGHAATYNMASVDYDGWELRDGQLLLHSSRNAAKENAALTDTFDILMLTTDTLVLSNRNLNTVFWRDN